MVCYSYGYSLPKETLLRDKLCRFGKIESILFRPAYNSSVRNYVLVEFATIEEAIECREFFVRGEDSFTNKLTLGDKRLEMNILVSSKVMRPFEALVVPSTTSSQQFPGLLSALSSGPTIPAVSMSQPVQSGGLAMIQTTLPLSNKAFLSDMDKTVNDEIRMIFDPEYIKAAKEKDTPPPLKLSIVPLFMHSDNRDLTFEEEVHIDSLVVKVDNGDPVDVHIEKNNDLLWSGFIIKGNDTKNTVGVDAYLISGDQSAFVDEMNSLWPADHILNMSHKCDYSELILPTPLTVMAFLPSNKTQLGKFLDFRNYFREKRIVTKVRHFRNKILYIFPYCKEFSEIVPMEDGNYMIGVFAESKGTQSAGSVNLPSIQMVDGAQVASSTSHTKEYESAKTDTEETQQENGTEVRPKHKTSDEMTDSFASEHLGKQAKRKDSVEVDDEGFESAHHFKKVHLGKRTGLEDVEFIQRPEPGMSNSPTKKLKTTVNLEEDLIAPIIPDVEFTTDNMSGELRMVQVEPKMMLVEAPAQDEVHIVLDEDQGINDAPVIEAAEDHPRSASLQVNLGEENSPDSPDRMLGEDVDMAIESEARILQPVDDIKSNKKTKPGKRK